MSVGFVYVSGIILQQTCAASTLLLVVSAGNFIILKSLLEAPTQTHDFERFQELVLSDRALHDQLRATANESAFIELAVRLAADRDCALTPDDFRRAIVQKRRAWLERWL